MSGSDISATHTHTVDCDNDCPLREGENVGVEYE